MVVSSLILPKAVQAAEVEATVTNVEVSGGGNTFRIAFDWQMPAGSMPGDYFEIVISPELEVNWQSELELRDPNTGDVVAVSEFNHNIWRTTLTEYAESHDNIRGGLVLDVSLREQLTEGEEKEVSLDVLSETIILTFTGPLPGMLINKWSGYSDASTQSKNLKLQSYNYEFANIVPVDGQIFAHWFVEINDLRYNEERTTLSNIVLVDTMQKVSGYTPTIERANPDTMVGVDLSQFILEGATYGHSLRLQNSVPMVYMLFITQYLEITLIISQERIIPIPSSTIILLIL